MILSVKSWRTKKKLNEPDKYADQNYRPKDSVSIYSCLSNNKKIEDLARIILYVTLIIEGIFRVFLMRNRRKVLMFYLASEVGKFVHVLAEKKVTLWWLMNSNIVKPGKFGHLHLVYHFTISLAKSFDVRNNFFVRS